MEVCVIVEGSFLWPGDLVNRFQCLLLLGRFSSLVFEEKLFFVMIVFFLCRWHDARTYFIFKFPFFFL